MTLLKLNELLSKKVQEGESQFVELPDVEKWTEMFQSMLLISEDYQLRFELTESDKEFYKACVLFQKVIPKEYAQEVFYRVKLGYYMKGVPSKLVFILQKAIRKYKLPNLAVNAINQSVLLPLISTEKVKDITHVNTLKAGLSVQEVIENIIGVTYRPLLEWSQISKHSDCLEVYVADDDRVAVLPLNYEKYFTDSMCTQLTFVKGEGLYIYGKHLLRTIDGTLGIIHDEFDLRGVI